MRAFAAVFGREIAEYRLIFPAALLIGLVALASPWLPGTGGNPPAEIRGAAALSLSLIVAFVLAAVLGSSVLTRDLAERRLGFYFARPLPGWALWSGKLAAAAVLASLAGALVLLPAFLAGGRLDPRGYWLLGGPQPGDATDLILLLPLGVIVLLLLTHALSTMVRARSPWLLLDLVAALAVVAVFRACRESLWSEGAVEALDRGASLFLLAALVSATVASAVQILRGRTDLRRGHRLLSLTLWGCLGAASVAFAGYTSWVLHVEPEDLTRLEAVVPAPAGTWIGLTGRAAGRGSLYRPTFLFDVASGRFVRIRSMGYDAYGWNQPFFSADGRRAVWVDQRSRGLLSLDLSRPEAEPVPSQVSYPALPRHLTLSPDGTRVAALLNDRLTVDDLAAGRLLASLPMSFDYGDRALFMDNRRIRIFQTSRELAPGSLDELWRLVVLDFDLATRRLRQVARLSSVRQPWSTRSGDLVFLRRSASEVEIMDLGTGKVLVTVPERPLGVEEILADGKMVLVARDSSRQRVTLRVLGRDGAELSRATFAAGSLMVGGQPLPGALVVATSPGRMSWTPQLWTSWLVELATGRVRKIGPGLMPVTLRAAGPRSVASRLFSTGDGGLVLVDPVTGRRRTVLEPGS